MQLYEPITIGGVELQNRVVFPPTVMYRSDMRGCVTDYSRDIYSKISKGGVGLMVIEATFINPIVPGLLCIFDDMHIPGLKSLVDLTHSESDAKISIQLIDPMPGFYNVDNLPMEWLKFTQMQYVNAAARAQEAGFDFIELHGAHGYVISYFLSLRNRRKDEYGGNLKNRMRFVNEIIDGIRERCGKDFPIGIRLNAEEFITGGNTLQQTTQIAKKLSSDKGLVYLNLTAGGKHEDAMNIVGNQLKWPYAAPGPWKDYHGYSGHRSMPPNYMPDGVNVYLAEAITKAVKETTDDFDKRAKVFACGKIPTPEFANTILEEGKADCVSVCRAILCDHEWANKGKEGRSDEIIKCKYCNICMQSCGEGYTRCVQWKEEVDPMAHFGLPPIS